MHVSEQGYRFIKSFEGRALRAYRDPVGVMTVGYGLTNMDKGLPWKVAPGLVITEEDAEKYLHRSIENNYEPAVARALPNQPQNVFDAGSSFHYNTGAIAKATWPRAWLRSDNASARASLLSWNKGGGRVLPGLTRRRNAEWRIISAGDYGSTAVPNLDRGKGTVPAKANTPGMIQEGSSGDDVRELQRMLRDLGYHPDVDGHFDSATVKAVEDFQAHHPGLTKDGVIGPATKAQIVREHDLRDKAVDAAKKTGGGVLVGTGAWQFLGLSAGKWLAVGAGVLALAVVVYLGWRYRSELSRSFNRMIGRETP